MNEKEKKIEVRLRISRDDWAEIKALKGIYEYGHVATSLTQSGHLSLPIVFTSKTKMSE